MAVWGEVDRWVYEYFDTDIEPDEFVGFEDLARLWHGKKNGRLVPTWDDFDFYDFVGWHGWITVYDITYDPFDYVVRLSGVDVDGIYGQTMTGMSLGEISQLRLENNTPNAFYEMTCRHVKIAKTEGPLNIRGRDFVRLTYLEFPLSDDGERATHSIEAIRLHGGDT